MIHLSELSAKIKEKAIDLGFSSCGIAKAAFLEDEKSRLYSWIENGNHASMEYLERNIDKRLDPRLVVENAKSVISVILNYFPVSDIQQNFTPRIAKYAYGQDYHVIIKEKLKELLNYINTIVKTNGRAFVDSAPILDSAWAVKAGLGWIGKNSLFIHPEFGSFVFIGELIIDTELNYDIENEKQCGNCTKCIDACPLNAIVSPYVINANKCISYLTKNVNGEIPPELTSKFSNWIFGCDICQDVCPFNKNCKPTNINEFIPKQLLREMKDEDWMQLDQKKYTELAAGTVIQDMTYEQFKRNLSFVKKDTNNLSISKVI